MTEPATVPGARLTVVAAPDSFKGSLTALEVARAMAEGARRACGPDVVIHAVPMADGGEGTLDALLDAWQGREMTVEVPDALGRPRTARYGLSTEGTTAVIEAAEANGLPHVRDVPAQPLRADSAGVGRLAAAALDAGATEILLCIGGSASTDGATGMLRELGVRFLDAAGRPTTPGGGAMTSIERIDLDGVHPRARQARWRIAVDVENPLVGDRGAAAVFGPQKGATPADIATLDAGLSHLAAKVATVTGVDAQHLLHGNGMGAAGGLPAALVAVLGAEVVPGARLVAEAVGLPHLLAGADIVLTGEGSFDGQSLNGKVVDGVRAYASPAAAVAVIAGRVELSATQIAAAGLAGAVSIARGPATEHQLTAQAGYLVAEAAEGVCRLLRWNVGDGVPR